MAPEILKGIPAARAWREAVQPGASVGFVPTMGALHEGHESLIRAARARDDRVAVSIYVNPSQFGQGEDFSSYPRDLEGDAARAGRAGADVVLTFLDREMYPEGYSTWVEVGGVSEGLCGASRPGHFRGVATIVTKLFHLLRPHRAYFGQKDAQQVAVLRRMARDLDFGIEIAVEPTVREDDGLALSSRNRYLSPEERRRAVCLRRALLEARKRARGGVEGAAELKEAMRAVVAAEGGGLAALEYVEIVDPESFLPVATVGRRALAALAVRVGRTRLIDNDFLGPLEPEDPEAG